MAEDQTKTKMSKSQKRRAKAKEKKAEAECKATEKPSWFRPYTGEEKSIPDWCRRATLEKDTVVETKAVYTPSHVHAGTAPGGVVKPARAAQEVLPTSPDEPAGCRGAQKGKHGTQTDSFQCKVHEASSNKAKENQDWACAYQKAVQQVQKDFDLQAPIPQYQVDMCELGRVMLIRGIARKTEAILKSRETRHKQKQKEKVAIECK